MPDTAKRIEWNPDEPGTWCGSTGPGEPMYFISKYSNGFKTVTKGGPYIYTRKRVRAYTFAVGKTTATHPIGIGEADTLAKAKQLAQRDAGR